MVMCSHSPPPFFFAQLHILCIFYILHVDKRDKTRLTWPVSVALCAVCSVFSCFDFRCVLFWLAFFFLFCAVGLTWTDEETDVCPFGDVQAAGKGVVVLRQ